jgi:hypothetical protein
VDGDRKRRHRVARRFLVGGVVALALLVLTALALNLRLTHHVGRVDGAFDDLGDRPPAESGTTVLLIGTMADGSSSASSVGWLPTATELESVMLVDVAADGRQVTVDSFRLDPSLVAAVTAAEASRAVAAVEDRTGRRVDHLMVMDWAMLQQLADENGTGLTYRAGASVRHQQRFLDTVLKDTLHTELRKQPWTVYRVLDTVSRGMAVEAGWSVYSMDLLVLSLRDLRSADIEFRVP